MFFVDDLRNAIHGFHSLKGIPQVGHEDIQLPVSFPWSCTGVFPVEEVVWKPPWHGICKKWAAVVCDT